MKKILRIQKKIKNVVISFDDESSLKIRYEVALKNGLRKGDVLSDTRIADLFAQNNRRMIKETAFNYLAGRDHSVFELKNKLRRKYRENDEIIRKVVEELIEEGFLNDEKFARDFVDSQIRLKKFGVAKLRAELLKKGIDREIVNDVLSKYSEEDFEKSALEIARARLDKLMRMNLAPEKIKRRLYGFLKSRGYNDALIYSVFTKLKLDEE
jgi:regulatory protein